MKKIFVFFTISLLFFIPFQVIHAQNGTLNQNKIVTLPKTEVVNKDYFAAGDVVNVSGTVNGDVYAFGKQVNVDGVVNGDVIAAGGSVNISGKVSSNVRAAGGQIIISADVGRNLTIGGGSVDLTDSAKIGGNAIIGAGNVTIASLINGDARVGAGDLTLSGKIGGDLDTAAGSLTLSRGSQVDGNVTYRSDENATIDSGAIVSGKIIKRAPSAESSWSMPGGKTTEMVQGIFARGRILSLIFTLILGSILVHFFPKFMSGGVDKLNENPSGILGRGFLIFILIPVIMILFGITIIGIPIALIILVLYLIAIYVARMIAIFWLGIFISEKVGKMERDILAFTIGLVAYTILRYIPVVSGITALFTAFFGLGAVWRLYRERNQAVRKVIRRK
jgi:cytoskeletal protein CcmA (bactofilin family)